MRKDSSISKKIQGPMAPRGNIIQEKRELLIKLLIKHLRRVRELQKKKETQELDSTGCKKQWLQPRTAKKKPPKMKPSPLRPESLSPDVFLALCSFDSHLSPLNIFVVMLWTFSGLHIRLSEGEELMLLRHINILFTGRIL